MAESCRNPDPGGNPGLALGAAMAAAASSGRDKLTLVMPDRLSRLALWIEQLVAESTGKQGKGLVPVTGERPAHRHGADRLVVETTFGEPIVGGPGDAPPALTLEMPDVAALGAEFFRWEVATAAAGFLLGINPFDEPNVQQAKDAARAPEPAAVPPPARAATPHPVAAFEGPERQANRYPMAAEVEIQIDGNRAWLVDLSLTGALLDCMGGLRLGEPDAAIDGARICLTAAARARSDGRMPPAILELLRPSDYFALLAYLPEHDPFAATLEHLRSSVADACGCAATLGYGPRYLHSTGQLHKGGPDSGVFLIVTATPADDLQVPGEPYSFGVLEMAQAVGDFESLDRAGRRAVHVHLPSRDPRLLERVAGMCLRRTP